jgi:hypothetical protein
MLEKFEQIILFEPLIPLMRIQLETLSSSEDFNHDSKLPSMSTLWSRGSRESILDTKGTAYAYISLTFFLHKINCLYNSLLLILSLSL